MAINISKIKTPCFIRKEEERISDFNEIVFGYSKEEAALEASRCLNCKNPTCISGCPAANNIPLFISYIKNDNLEEAYKVLKLTSNMPEICSRVCDQAKQCELNCIRAKSGESVSIGLLERYVSDNISVKISAEPQYLGLSVAIIGSGPAGLSCAEELNKLGYNVTIFEKESYFGGLLMYGIPNYRLPVNIVNKKIDYLKEKGIKFVANQTLGKDFTIENLKYSGFAAIFIAIGAQKEKYMHIEGENLSGLYTANEFLKYTSSISKNLNSHSDLSIGKKVAVIGGGNSAIDAARSALRLLDVETVEIIYRRTIEDMPAAKVEIEDAIKEGIKLNTLTNPLKLIGENGSICSVLCTKMEQTGVGRDGRRSVRPIEGSEFIKNFDTVIYAIGNDTDDILKTLKGVELNKWNNIVVNEDNSSRIDNSIFAAGDVVTGPATVVKAMAKGKETAHKIDQYLKNI